MRERVIDAFVADFQREWFHAATLRQRAFVTVRAYGSFAGIIAEAAYRWMYQTSLTMAWPFLVRRQPNSVIKPSHRD